MQSEAVGAFKRELRSYKGLVKYVGFCEDKIQYYVHMLGGYKGINLSGVRVNSPPNKEVEYKIRGLITYWEDEKDITSKRIRKIVDVLNEMPSEVRMATIGVYIENKTIDKMAEKYFYSHASLSREINKQIEIALKRTPVRDII